MRALNPDGPVPLWRQLADAIRARIESGEFPAGRALPSRKQLEQEYGTGQKTAEHALRWLANKGVIQTVTGKGSYVIGPGGHDT
jgi:GntR family transcriptional regulator